MQGGVAQGVHGRARVQIAPWRPFDSGPRHSLVGILFLYYYPAGMQACAMYAVEPAKGK